MAIKRKIQRSAEAELILLSEAFEDFMTEKRAQGVSEATLRNYEQSYRYFCRYNGIDEDATADEVTERYIFRWINAQRNDNIKNTSINHYLRDVRTFLYWCMADPREYISPAFKIKLVEGQEELPKMFSDEDIELLLQKPKKGDSFVTWRTWAIVNWILGTGNRSTTICNVKIADVDFRKKEIIITHTKNKKNQILPLSTATASAIKEYMRIWRKGADPDTYLFSNIGEEQLTTNALRHAFTNYCRDRGVNQTNIHGLRHNYAKACVQNNLNIYKLQQMLGHSTIAMTRKYVVLYSEDLKEGYDDYSPLDTIKKSRSRAQKLKRNDDY